MIDDLIAPVTVPEIDEGVMSYRAALVGNNEPNKQENGAPKLAASEIKVRVRD